MATLLDSQHGEDPRRRAISPRLASIGTWLFGVLVVMVLDSPYWGDDTTNHHIRSILRAAHTTLGAYIWHVSWGYLRVDANFFPLGWAWIYGSFDVFDNRTSDKLVLAIVLLVAISLVALIIATFARTALAGAGFVLIAPGLLQVREWADPLTSFSAHPTVAAIPAFGALLILLKRAGRRWTTLAAGILFLAALLTYNAVIVLAPGLIMIVVAARRDWRPALAFVLPSVVPILITLAVRITDSEYHPSVEYMFSFLPGPAATTFVKQLAAALPLSQWWLGDHISALPAIGGTFVLLCAVVIGAPVFIGLAEVGRLWSPDGRTVRLIGSLGVLLWIFPALLIGLTKRWQQVMPWGEGFISVVYEYLGVTLLLLALWFGVSVRLRNHHRLRAARAWNLACVTLLASAATLTMAGNFSVLDAALALIGPN